jgi:hypothetical protein
MSGTEVVGMADGVRSTKEKVLYEDHQNFV